MSQSKKHRKEWGSDSRKKEREIEQTVAKCKCYSGLKTGPGKFFLSFIKFSVASGKAVDSDSLGILATL